MQTGSPRDAGKVRTEPSPPPQCRVMSWPAVMDEGRTVNAMRELLDWAMVDATSDAQTKRALAKYIVGVVALRAVKGGTTVKTLVGGGRR